MKREILFKAKDLDTSEWVSGYYGDDGVRETIIFSIEMLPSGDSEIICHSVLKNTVCQYTGFTDKNGKKVFEGDYDKDGNCVVFCDECHGWQFGEIDIPTKDICIPCHNCDGNFMIGDWIEKFEVIGNING